MIDSPLPSAFEPPTDPDALFEWLDEQEQRIADVVADVTTKVVRDAYRAFLDTLTAAGDLGALDSIPQQWMIGATGRILPELNGMFLAGGIAAWTRSGGTASSAAAGVWADVVNQNAVQYMTKASNRLAGVGNNVWWGVRSMVRKAVEGGASNEELKAQIEDMTRFSEFRADTIARTETVGAYNNGNYAGNLALGDQGPAEKWWLATRDDRTRPDHLAAQPLEMGGTGRVIAYNEAFEVGGVDMLHPHAEGAPAEQVVNCRCVLITLYPGDERPDGTIVPEPLTPPEPQPPTPPSPPEPPKPRPARKQARRPRTGIPEEGFATADEAVDYLERQHPHVLWGQTVRTMGAQNLTGVARSAERLQRTYPDEWAQMVSLSTQNADDVAQATTAGLNVPKYKWEANVYAHAYTWDADKFGKGVIGINPKWFADDALLGRVTAENFDTEWMVGGSVESLTDHEFGHLYRYLRMRNDKLAKIQAARDQGRSVIEVMGYGYMRPDGNYTLNDMQAFLFNYAQRRTARLGSRYGASNAEEAFAECFAAREFLRRGGQATDGLRSMASIMDAFDELVEVSQPSTYVGFDPVARLRALEAVDDVLKKHGISTRPKGFKQAMREAQDYLKDNPHYLENA